MFKMLDYRAHKLYIILFLSTPLFAEVKMTALNE